MENGVSRLPLMQVRDNNTLFVPDTLNTCAGVVAISLTNK